MNLPDTPGATEVTQRVCCANLSRLLSSMVTTGQYRRTPQTTRFLSNIAPIGRYQTTHLTVCIADLYKSDWRSVLPPEADLPAGVDINFRGVAVKAKRVMTWNMDGHANSANNGKRCLRRCSNPPVVVATLVGPDSLTDPRDRAARVSRLTL